MTAMRITSLVRIVLASADDTGTPNADLLLVKSATAAPSS